MELRAVRSSAHAGNGGVDARVGGIIGHTLDRLRPPSCGQPDGCPQAVDSGLVRPPVGGLPRLLLTLKPKGGQEVGGGPKGRRISGGRKALAIMGVFRFVERQVNRFARIQFRLLVWLHWKITGRRSIGREMSQAEREKWYAKEVGIHGDDPSGD